MCMKAWLLHQHELYKADKTALSCKWLHPGLCHVYWKVIIQSHKYPQALWAVIRFSWWFGGYKPLKHLGRSIIWQCSWSINDFCARSLWTITNNLVTRFPVHGGMTPPWFGIYDSKYHRGRQAWVIDCCHLFEWRQANIFRHFIPGGYRCRTGSQCVNMGHLFRSINTSEMYSIKKKKKQHKSDFPINVQILKTLQLGTSLPSQQEFD